MIRSVRAIVRRAVPECHLLVPGDVVQVSRLAFCSGFGLRFPVCLEANPVPLFWLEPDHLLPYREFLQRRPSRDYWALLYRPHIRRNDPRQYMSNPNTETFGPVAFQFESLGEVLHYVRLHELNLSHFNVTPVLGLEAYPNLCRTY